MTDKNGVEIKIGDFVRVFPEEAANIKKYYGTVGKIVKLKKDKPATVKIRPYIETLSWFSYKLIRLTDEEAMIYLLEK